MRKRPEKKVDLKQYGPWKLLSRAEARQLPATGDGRPFVLSIISGESDAWTGLAGFHFVNVVEYFQSSRPMPPDFTVEDVWFDEDGEPVAGDD